MATILEGESVSAARPNTIGMRRTTGSSERGPEAEKRADEIPAELDFDMDAIINLKTRSAVA